MISKLHYVLISSALSASVFAGEMGSIQNSQGLFIGAGGNYSSLRVHQNSSGLGISNQFTEGVLTSQSIGQGSAAPFTNTSLTFSPEVQAGFIRSFNADFFYGFKFNYQYLNLTATNHDYILPQTGEIEFLEPPVATLAANAVPEPAVTNSIVGYASADAVETTVNHQMNLLAFFGKQFNNKNIYLGAGPSVISLKSRYYNFANNLYFSQDAFNVTGLINYGSRTQWAWGGAAQIGMSYFFSPSWFVDASYTYSIYEDKTTKHSQTFYDSSSTLETSFDSTGEIFIKDTFKTTRLQSVNVSINKLFDI